MHPASGSLLCHGVAYQELPHVSLFVVLLQAVGSALQVLQLCARAAQLIEGKQLYKAYKVLEAIQRDHGALLRGDSGYSSASRLPAGSTAWPSVSVSSEAGSREGTPHKASNPAAAAGTPTAGTPGAMGPAQRAGSGGSGAQLGALAAFLRERVAGLTAALEQRAIADFHNWLTSVRAQARVVGLRAVRRAALERQQEEQLARQRKLLLPRLEGLADVRAAGQLAAQSLQAPGVAQPAPPTPLEAPPAVGTPAAAAAAKLSPLRGAGSPADSPTAARAASFRAARQTASSPTRAAATAANGAAGSPSDSPRSAASSSRAAAAPAGPLQTPPPAHARRLPRAETAATTGARRCRRHEPYPCCGNVHCTDYPAHSRLCVLGSCCMPRSCSCSPSEPCFAVVPCHLPSPP